MSIELDSFLPRCLAQQKFERKRQEEGTEWRYIYPGGLFRGSVLQQDDPVRLPDRTERFIVLPHVIRGYIADLQKIKNGPILVLDIGGGAGIDWRENATNYENEVRRGEIAFIVSNLVTTNPSTFHTGRNLHETKLSQKGKPLVQFIQSTFADLKRQTITLPNGAEVPLAGNVDIVHERYSFTAWSNIPEMSILHAARLLSPVGMYVVPNYDIRTLQQSKREPELRRNGIRHAHELLQQSMGLQKVTHFEGGPLVGGKLVYTIFKKPGAPLIRI